MERKDLKSAAFEKAFKYLSGRSRSISEMALYLERKGYPQEIRKEVIDQLLESGYLNDEKYAISFIEYGVNKKWGKRRIMAELAKRGVAMSIFKRIIEEGEEKLTLSLDFQSERTRAKTLGQRFLEDKRAAGKIIDEKILASLGRKLMSSGYESEVIYKTIADLRRELGDELLREDD